MELRGRTPAGDWVYVCCVNNVSAWARVTHVTIANNTLLPGVTSTAEPNDPRWLPTQRIDPLLTPRPVPTAIPYTDFPLARYDIGNTGRVPYLSLTPMQSIWADGGRAGGSFASPLAVLGQSVLASSSDNNLYGFYLEVGNQSWKLNLQAFTNLAPAIQDDLIYLAYGRTITAVRVYASASEWQRTLDADATTPFTIWLDSLFIGVGENDGAKLVAIRRLNPDDRKEFGVPISRIQLPAIGQETLFIGADRLWAVDINFWDGTENGRRSSGKTTKFSTSRRHLCTAAQASYACQSSMQRTARALCMPSTPTPASASCRPFNASGHGHRVGCQQNQCLHCQQ